MQPIAVFHELPADGVDDVGFDPFVRLVDDLGARADRGA